jgi:hypothetical protein
LVIFHDPSRNLTLATSWSHLFCALVPLYSCLDVCRTCNSPRKVGLCTPNHPNGACGECILGAILTALFHHTTALSLWHRGQSHYRSWLSDMESGFQWRRSTKRRVLCQRKVGSCFVERQSRSRCCRKGRGGQVFGVLVAEVSEICFSQVRPLLTGLKASD